MSNIESWWRHNGAFDRAQASGIPYESGVTNLAEYLNNTDDWWDGLSDEKKKEVYEEFFSEV